VRWLLFHFVGGDALYTGAVVLVLGLLSSRRRGKIAATARDLLGVLGVSMMVMASAPISVVWYVLLGASTLAWLIASHFRRAERSSLAAVTSGALLVIVGYAVAHEALEERFRRPATDPKTTLVVLGDSVSAGITGPERAWPAVFGRTFGVDVTNLSRVAARAEDLVGVAEHARFDHTVVLVEIGGNDLLFGTPPLEFEAGLRALLGCASSPTSTLVMFELPLWPGRVELGRIQRRLAAEMGVTLVPRRVFAGVLAPPDATVDGLHLTEVGTARMAATVHDLVGPLLAARP
jgi:lysophospholipase L1-like esterase